MNKALIIIGVVVLVLGIFANVYSETTTNEYLWGLYSTSSTSIPYSSYSTMLLIGGIILILAGALIKEGKR